MTNKFQKTNICGNLETESSLENDLDKFLDEFLINGEIKKNIKVQKLRSIIPKFQKNYRERNNIPKTKSNWDNHPPANWPENLPYQDPNNPKNTRKLQKNELQQILQVFIDDYKRSNDESKVYLSGSEVQDLEGLLQYYDTSQIFNNNFEEQNSLFSDQNVFDIQTKDLPETISESDMLWDASQRLKMKLTYINNIMGKNLPKDIEKQIGNIQEMENSNYDIRSERNLLEIKLDEIKMEHNNENKMTQDEAEQEEDEEDEEEEAFKQDNEISSKFFMRNGHMVLLSSSNLNTQNTLNQNTIEQGNNKKWNFKGNLHNDFDNDDQRYRKRIKLDVQT